MTMDLWDRIWKDEHGQVVIWQWPNVYLYAWAVLAFISLLTSQRTSDIFAGAGAVALAVWAILEIWKGANYFRRLLGLAVLVYAVITFVKIFK